MDWRYIALPLWGVLQIFAVLAGTSLAARGRGLGLSQHNISFPWCEREDLHQRVRRSKGAGRRLPRRQARTGGIKGSSGWRKIRRVFRLPAGRLDRLRLISQSCLPEEFVYSERTSIFFKHTHVFRIVDKKRNTLVYVALSDKIVEGSPQNSISTVPIIPWGIEAGQVKPTP